jgi:hypothetical protein
MAFINKNKLGNDKFTTTHKEQELQKTTDYEKQNLNPLNFNSKA